MTVLDNWTTLKGLPVSVNDCISMAAWPVPCWQQAALGKPSEGKANQGPSYATYLRHKREEAKREWGRHALVACHNTSVSQRT